MKVGAEGLKRIGPHPLYLPAHLGFPQQPESVIQPTWPVVPEPRAHVVPEPRAHVVPLATPGAATSCLQHWLLSIPPRQRAGRTLYPSLGALGSEGVSEGPGPGEFHQPQERLQESCSTDSHLTFLLICKVGQPSSQAPSGKLILQLIC